MREIKFRAWDKEIQHMIQGSPISMATIMKNYIGNAISFNGVRLSDRYEIMQFTGLLDKSGMEIYEGDIVKTSLGTVAVVEWENNGRFLGFTPDRLILYIGREPAVEIIGNIYENPELMEDK